MGLTVPNISIIVQLNLLENFPSKEEFCITEYQNITVKMTVLGSEKNKHVRKDRKDCIIR